jgi:uncharacterized protein (TIGR04141 family)
MRLSLTAFLLRAGLAPDLALSESARADAAYYEWTENEITAVPEIANIFEASQVGDIVIGVLSRPRGAAPWQRFLRDALELDLLGVGGQTVGAFVFCAVPDPSTDEVRWLTWTFGSAARSIDRRQTDARFGLLVTLNTLAAAIVEGRGGAGRTPQLRTINYRTTAPFFQQTGTRAAQDIPVSAFRFDQQSDLVSAAGGRTGDEAIPVVFGGRSLGFTTDVSDLPELVQRAQLLVARSGEELYKRSYAWVDNITLESDPRIVTALRDDLAALLVISPVPANLDALLPDDYLGFDENAIEFVVLPRERTRGASRVILTIDRIGQFAQNFDVPVDALDAQLRFLDANRVEVATATVMECLCAELRRENELFIAYEGDFFRVDTDFIRGLDLEVADIETTALDLPPYGGGSEPSYLDSVRRDAPNRLLVVDRQLLRLHAERGGIEAADILSTDGYFVHVKRKGKSSVLSHLFFQAGNSADLLRRSLEARDQLAALIPESQAPATLLKKVAGAVRDPTGNEVVFAILGDWRDRDVRALPLFSKISLVQAVRRLRLLGYRPSLALISTAFEEDTGDDASAD